MLRAIHIFDGVCVVLGLTILVAAFLNISVAEAAGATAILDQDAHPFVVLAGFTLTTLPVGRRLLFHVFVNQDNVIEFHQIGSALHRMGLLNRVQVTNLYLAGLSDESWRNVFANDDELWNWLGEAYRDPALRQQMHPDVARRTEVAGQRRRLEAAV